MAINNIEYPRANIPEYSPDMVSRNIKVVNEDVIEVRRYNDANIRYIVLLHLFAVCFYWTWDIITPNQGLHNDMEWAWNAEERKKDLLDWRRDDKNPEFTIMGKPIAEYEKELSERVKKYKRKAWIILSIPLWLLILAGFPRWRPLRFDSKRRIVYFWFLGRFYITRYPEFAKKNKEVMNYLSISMQHPWLRSYKHGGLVFHIPHESGKGNLKKVDVGIYRPACKFQNYVLLNFLNDYLSDDKPTKTYAKYFKKENFILSDAFNWFYQFRLFPSFGYNEKKTEAKIQAWLANNPEDENTNITINW